MRQAFISTAKVLAIASASILFATSATAQAPYPTKPIELIVPYAAGGGTDALARAFADAARKHTNQPFIVVNRPGASGAIGVGEVIRAAPDGYKITVIATDVLTVPLLGLGKVNHEDLQAIAQLNYDPAAVTVRADAPWNTLDEFLKAGGSAKCLTLRLDGEEAAVW